MMLSLISLAFLAMLLGACASIMHDLTRPLAVVDDNRNLGGIGREVARIVALPRPRPRLVTSSHTPATSPLMQAPLAA